MARREDRMRFRLFLALGIIAFSARPVVAQPPSGAQSQKPANRYVPFAIEGDAQALVEARLGMLHDQQQMQDLIARLLRDPSQLHLDDNIIAKFKKYADDPGVQDQLKSLRDTSKQGKDAVPPAELAKKFEKIVRQVVKEKESSPPSPQAPLPDGFSGGPPMPNPPADAPDPPDAEAGVRDWLKDMMERAEESNLGEWLRESPAFQQALHDLHGSVRMPEMKPTRWGLDHLLRLDKLPKPDAAALERLGRFKPKLPQIHAPHLPSLSRPSLPPVSAPLVPTMSSLGTLAIWLLCLALLALFAWQVSRWIGLPGRAARDAAIDLGPWPVQPGAVATRRELVQAFDYLALLLLGVKARAWHHRAVAQAMARRAAPCAGAAMEIGALYEQARYTDGAETLADADRDRARAALLQLVGGAR
jgi:hypothetical protein